MATSIRTIRIYQTAIPFRRPFVHAGAARTEARNLIVEVELHNGKRGFGEGVPRDYVTGETLGGCVGAVQTDLLDVVSRFAPDTFGDLLNALEALPFTTSQGRCCHSARCAVELACLDAWSRHFRRSLKDIIGWMGLQNFVGFSSLPRVRYSGVVSADHPKAVLRSIRKMRLFGLRDLKVKVGFEGDDEVLALLDRYHGRIRFRADANGAWKELETAKEKLALLARAGFCCIEQPMPTDCDDALPALARATDLPIMVDESLVSMSDARRHIEAGGVKLFNIRISKNGGLIPAIRLAQAARNASMGYQLGCMVGETAILSAAGRWFLQLVPDVSFAEGSFGTFLLKRDISSRQFRFGFGGRAKPMKGFGLGPAISASTLAALTDPPPLTLHLG